MHFSPVLVWSLHSDGAMMLRGPESCVHEGNADVSFGIGSFGWISDEMEKEKSRHTHLNTHMHCSPSCRAVTLGWGHEHISLTSLLLVSKFPFLWSFSPLFSVSSMDGGWIFCEYIVIVLHIPMFSNQNWFFPCGRVQVPLTGVVIAR